MNLEKNCALLVIDIQQEDFMEMNENNMNDPRWAVIRNGKRVLDVFRAKKLPVIQIKECRRPDMVDFGRELDGSEGIHCVENRPENDYAKLTSCARPSAFPSWPQSMATSPSARCW